MSADQSIIDLTNETQEELVAESSDDIEIISQKLRRNNEPVVYKISKKRPSPDILEIDDSPQRTKISRRRSHTIRVNDDSIPMIHENTASGSNIITTPFISRPAPPPIISPGFECPICLEKHKDNLVVTVCGHIFCQPCMKESMKASKQCPKCRKKMTARSFHPIFI